MRIQLEAISVALLNFSVSWLGGRSHFVCLATLLLFGQSSSTYAQDLSRARKAEILDKLAKQSAANFANIATWQGEYKVTDVYPVTQELLSRTRIDAKPPGNGPWTRQDTGDVEFSFDAIAQSVYTSIEMTDCRLIRDANDDPINVELPRTSPQRSIITPTHFYSFAWTENWPDLKDIPAVKGVFGPIAFREPLERVNEQVLSTIVDPRRLFAYSRFFWEELEHFSTQLKSQSADSDRWDKAVRVKSFRENGADRYVIELRLPHTLDGDDIRLGRFTVQPKVASNFTGVMISDPRKGTLFQSVSWEYVEIDGVFVPSKMTRKNFKSSDGSLSMMRLLEMKDSRLNEPIEPSTFSVSNLGLKNGERVVDRVEKVCYLYKDGALVNPVGFDEAAAIADSNDESRGSLAGWWIIGANIIIIAILMYLLLSRRK